MTQRPEIFATRFVRLSTFAADRTLKQCFSDAQACQWMTLLNRSASEVNKSSGIPAVVGRCLLLEVSAW